MPTTAVLIDNGINVTNFFFPSVNGHPTNWPLGAAGELVTTLNAVIDPDGTQTACLLTADATTGSSFHQLNINLDGSANFLVANTVYTLSIYAKAGTSSRFQFSIRVATNWVGGIVVGEFNLTAVTAVCSSGNGTATITDVGGGWFRTTVSGTTAASGLAALPVFLYLEQQSNGSASFAGTGQSMAFWGGQFNIGPAAGNYIPTTIAAATALGPNGLSGIFNPKTKKAISILSLNKVVRPPMLTRMD